MKFLNFVFLSFLLSMTMALLGLRIPWLMSRIQLGRALFICWAAMIVFIWLGTRFFVRTPGCRSVLMTLLIGTTLGLLLFRTRLPLVAAMLIRDGIKLPHLELQPIIWGLGTWLAVGTINALFLGNSRFSLHGQKQTRQQRSGLRRTSSRRGKHWNNY